MAKKKYATISRTSEGPFITLNKPAMMLNKKMEAETITHVKQVPVPEPMSQSQWNDWIRSEEGQEWAAEILKAEVH